MSVKGINRMVKEINQLQNHKGRYYRKWLKAYTKWVRTRSAAVVRSNKMNTRWLAGMTGFIQDPKRKHDNT